MTTVTIHTAKTNLSRLIEKACAGEEVIIAHGRQPVVRLVPIRPPSQGRTFGAMRGKATVTEAYFEPLPTDELDAWDQ